MADLAHSATRKNSGLTPVLGLSRSGAILLGASCADCGTFHEIAEMTPQQALSFIAELQSLVALAARIQSLPVPYVAAAGEA